DCWRSPSPRRSRCHSRSRGLSVSRRYLRSRCSVFPKPLVSKQAAWARGRRCAAAGTRGEVAERSNALAWKASRPDNGLGSSNLPLSGCAGLENFLFVGDDADAEAIEVVVNVEVLH